MLKTREKLIQGENLEDKLYYNLYNPKDGVAQTNVELPDLNVNLSALYDITTEKDLSEDDEDSASCQPCPAGSYQPQWGQVC